MDKHGEIKYKCSICAEILPTRMAHSKHILRKHDIHEDISDYRIEIRPEMTKKDTKKIIPNRKKR